MYHLSSISLFCLILIGRSTQGLLYNKISLIRSTRDWIFYFELSVFRIKREVDIKIDNPQNDYYQFFFLSNKSFGREEESSQFLLRTQNLRSYRQFLK